MAWRDFWHNERRYELTHLNDVMCFITLEERPLTIRFSFGAHTFTDEKENGPHFHPLRRERRHICHRRHALSYALVHYMRLKFSEGHVRQHQGRHGEQWFTTELEGAAVFMAIQKSAEAQNEIKVRVISAYPLDRGLQALPSRGRLFKVRTVYKRKLGW